MSALLLRTTTQARLSSSGSSATSAHEQETSDQLPSARPVILSPSTRYTSKSSGRPKTAPSESKTPSNNPPAFEPPIPRIAIFADALSLKKLREQYQTVRKSPTLPDLSHLESRRSQSRRVNSASATTDVTEHNTPQLPELNFDSRASLRRAPASRSSHGVDNSKGPPPAIVTRSSYTSDAARRAQNPAAATFAQQRDKPYNLRSPINDPLRHTSNTFDGLPSHDSNSDIPFSPLSPGLVPPNFEQSLDAIMDQRSTYSDAQEYLEERALKRNSGLAPGQVVVSGADTEGSGQSTEDLFLVEAQDNPAPTRGYDSSDHLERRLSSRGRNTAQRTSLPVSSRPRRDSNGSHNSGAQSIIPTTERSYSGQRRASTTATTPVTTANLARNPSSLPADNRFNMYRNRYMTSTTPQHSSRRPSAPDTASMYSRPPAYRPSKLNQFSTREYDSMSMTDSPLEHRTFAMRSEHHHDGNESVVSGAQSTVWDELQELKSRIQRMEIHDKMVSTGSNGSNERPKTATTATTPLTTMSSSPKNQFKTGRSPQDSVIGGPAAVNAYPVLHRTLARCKEGLNPQVYRALEQATSDALELALLTGNTGAGGHSSGTASVVNGGFSGERQLKRKADNVVRNLQDLCVELCKVSPSEQPTTTSRPGTSNGLPSSSHGQPSGAAVANRSSMVRAPSRASSVDPSTAATSDTARAVPSRALDRIEARRASLMSTGLPSASNSPREAPEAFNRNSLQLPYNNMDSSPSQQISKLPRSGTSLLRSRRREGTEEPEEEPSPRPVSRAATDIGTIRKRQNRLSDSYALQRTSREYTSNVPLPNSSPVASTPPTTSALRRLNGTSLKGESPRSTSLASSLLREPRRAMIEKEKTPEPETPNTPAEEESGANRRLFRRSLGLYTSSARASLGLGLGKRAERRSFATAAGGE